MEVKATEPSPQQGLASIPPDKGGTKRGRDVMEKDSGGEDFPPLVKDGKPSAFVSKGLYAATLTIKDEAVASDSEEEGEIHEEYDSDDDVLQIGTEGPLKQLWSLSGTIQLIDLDNGYYCVKFSNSKDYDYVFTGGPWVITDHCLTVRRWTPYFRFDEATIDKVATWIRLPLMPIEFYDDWILRKIADLLGSLFVLTRPLHRHLVGNLRGSVLK
ncbi:hypothetical protein CCACVL1_08808 [Corchorus capsularis]|uniref:DUF4283 domain-containing protein n=1 Tax=Corchorus capsularis TaxID=210143 RepID=A0A1R3IYP9_COCAP|nr:hypothetical protein CCACVL1_08808 [Corchorus capsularis]